VEAQGLPELSSRRSRMLGDGSRRGVAMSTADVVVLAVLVGIFLLAPGSAQVRHTFFNPTDMWRSFVGDPKAGYYSVGEALWLNIRMFIAAEVLILIVALVVAVVRQSTGPVLLPLRVAATVYVDVARGVPLILIIFALGYGLPALQLTVISDQSVAVYGVVALVLSYSAYVAEVYRAGINSVHRSQVAAARSLGLSQSSSMRYVILPQAIRNIIPPLLNDFISLQKDTAQVGLLGAIEANKAAEIYSSTVFNYSSYVVAAILFLALTIPLARFTDHLIRRDQARRLAGAGQLWAERARFPFPVRGARKRCGSRGCASRSARTRCSAGWTWPWPGTRSSA
jgi:polar amino acid transport system permease protein